MIHILDFTVPFSSCSPEENVDRFQLNGPLAWNLNSRFFNMSTSSALILFATAPSWIPKHVFPGIEKNLFLEVCSMFKRRASKDLTNRVLVTSSDVTTDIASFSACALLKFLKLSFSWTVLFVAKLTCRKGSLQKVKRTNDAEQQTQATVKRFCECYHSEKQLRDCQWLFQNRYCTNNLVSRSSPGTSFVSLVLFFSVHDSVISSKAMKPGWKRPWNKGGK